MRILKQSSLNRQVKPGEKPEGITPEDITRHANASERKVLAFLNGWQVAAPRRCEFILTLEYAVTEDSGQRHLEFVTPWPRVWLVGPKFDPDSRNAVCVASFEWSFLVEHLLSSDKNNNGELRALLETTVHQGARNQHMLLGEAAQKFQESANFNSYMSLRCEDMAHGVVAPTE